MQQLTYLDFELEVQRAGNHYVARILHSPSGEVTQAFSIPLSGDKLENLVLKLGGGRRGTRGIRSVELEAARELGGKLFDAVFTGDLRACFKSSYDKALEEKDRGLRIKLRLQEVPELADIPWEYLFDPSTGRFLAHSDQTPIVRYLSIPEKVPALAVSFPLRILIMVSSPLDYPCLDVEHEKFKIREALKHLVGVGKVELEFLESATLTALMHGLRRQDCHMFHYIGHGGFDNKSEEGVLVLADDQGNSWLAGAHRVATVLHDCRSLRLAVFNACEGARNSQTDPFAGLAASVVRQGVPAVVGMQFEITDKAAIVFAQEFYGAIAEGFPVDAALAAARKAIYLAPNDVEWGTPVLYMRSADGVLFDLKQPVIEKEVVPVAPVPPKEPKKRKRRIWRAFGAAAAVLLIIFIWLGWSPSPPAPQRVSAPMLNLPTPTSNPPSTSTDSPQAVELRKAAVQGNAVAQNRLGVMYADGLGVAKNDAEAVQWYYKAAVQGNAVAQFNLGAMYSLGRGVPKNDAKAVEWCRKAAAQGHAVAQNNLGVMYADGRGVAKNDAEAVQWYYKAAVQGNAVAQFNLGAMYSLGRGVPKNDAKAVEWCRKAAAQGHADAQDVLKKRGLSW